MFVQTPHDPSFVKAVDVLQTPFLKLFVGPMFGSKTTRLLAEIDRLQRKSKVVYAFKPKKDTRFNDVHITSHNGASCGAFAISEGSEILQKLAELARVDVVAVDEAFMLPGCADSLIYAFRNLNVSILVSSIQMDANLRPFHEIKELMPWATSIDICAAICDMCDNDAFYTQADIEVSDTPVIGGAEIYKPMCFKHMKKLSSTLLK